MIKHKPMQKQAENCKRRELVEFSERLVALSRRKLKEKKR
jgi:hypothetical protein